MRKHTLSLQETQSFSKAFLNYIAGSEELKPFYQYFPSLENFKFALENRAFTSEKREALSEVFRAQYQDLSCEGAVEDNIRLLKDKRTFTVTTGHQLNIFTGPLYVIYKLITVINTCKKLKEAYPDFNFIPIYWMASEDHDFEEISSFFFAGEERRWFSEQQGAVGRFDPRELKKMAAELPEAASFFIESYNASTLAAAVRNYINQLFGDKGLLVLDADNPALKRSLIPIMKADLFSYTTEKIVASTSERLSNLGFHPQVHARKVNFFYLEGELRKRIVAQESKNAVNFEVLDTSLVFSATELEKLIDSNPERFSPNVILRPLYQELILPNLAYVGGPSELVYWLQLKDLFDHHSVSFPILLPRNFATILSKADQKRAAKLDLSHPEFFEDNETLFASWVKRHANHKLDFGDELSQLSLLEEEMKARTSPIDPTLSQHLEAINASFRAKVFKAEKKLVRAEKRLHADKQRQIENLKSSIFPGGVLQERKVNFLDFYTRDSHFLDKLKETFDPFVFEMYLLFEGS
ncbi:MAG: bacillithiol biosynthesis cysteine-adding enzyme BshC [Bacteroidota bacterium]